MKETHLRSFLWVAALILLSTILTAEVRAAAPETNAVCSAQANENPLVKGRSKSITFPDGRVLTVVGHMHGDRQINEINDLVENGKLGSMSDGEFNQLLLRISNENRQTEKGLLTRRDKLKFVDHFRNEYGVDISRTVQPEKGFDLPPMTVENHAVEDFKFLSQALAQPNSKIRFVGFEASQETWTNNTPYYKRARQELLRQFYIRKDRGQISFNEEQIETLILSASNGNVYTYMTNPDLSKRVPVFGSEDPKVAAESKRVAPLTKMYEVFQKVISADDAYWNSKTEKEKQQFKTIPSNILYVGLLLHVYSEVKNMNVSSYAELDTLIHELRKGAPPWIQASLEEFFRSLRERVRINFARDYESAKNLVGRHETGIHFVGLNHFNNTIANLENFCKQELTGSNKKISIPHGE